MDRAAAAPPALARLSAPYTFIYKYVFPPVWLVMMGVAVALAWIRPEVFPEYATGWPLLDASHLKWAFAGVYLITFASMWWLLFGLKRVDLRAEGLIVSNYLRSDAIAFHDIAEVRELKLIEPRSILLVLRTPCRFGTRVRFLPTLERGGWLRDHPTATLLRERAGL